MVAAIKHFAFVENVAEKVHNLGADTLRFLLTNVAPTNANSVKADLTEIAAGSGYTAGGTAATISSSAQTSGLYTLIVGDVVFTASGAMATFRYTSFYNDTPTSPADPLIQSYDYGSAVSLQSGETFTVDTDQGAGILTLQ
jgi:hypothetical protein